MRFLTFLPLCLFSFLLKAQTLQTVIQKGHELPVTAVAVSIDTNLIATASRDRSAKLWEVSSGREVRSFLGHRATVTALDFTPDGKFLITGSNDKNIKIWNVDTGKEIETIATSDYITDLAIDPFNRFFIHSGYNDSGNGDSVVVYDFKTRKVIHKISVSPDKGMHSGVDAAISPDGQFVLLGEDNRMATLYSTVDWTKVYTFEYTEGYCGGCGTRVQFSPDNKFIYIASNNSAVKKYSRTDFRLVKMYEEKCEDLSGFSISADGKLLVAATEKEIRIWDTVTGELNTSIEAEANDEFHEVTFTSTNRELLIPSLNNTAFTWSIDKRMKEKIFSGFLHEREKGELNYQPTDYWQSHIARYVRFRNSLMIANDGKSLIKGNFGTKIKQWNIANGKTIMEFVGHKKAVLCYDLSKDGKQLITGGGDGKIIVWDVASGDSLQVIQSYREPIFDIHFNSDETKVLSSSWDATMKIHDVSTGKMNTYFDFQNTSAYSVLYHPNDLYVFSARLDNTIQMWEIDTRASVRNFIGHTGIVSSLKLSSDQQILLSAGWDGSIRMWNVGTGLMTKKFKSNEEEVHIAVFSPDEKLVYAAGADRLIRVWDVNTGKTVRSFEGHNAEVTALLFSNDNKMLISHSVDGATKFWDLESGKEFFEHIHLDENEWMVKSPEGYFHGTERARRYIHFVEGVKTYSVDQFFNDFYRPDLLPQIFKNRGSDNDWKNVQGKLKSAPPALVKVAALPLADNKAEVYVRMTHLGADVKELRLLHNGKSIELNKPELVFPKLSGNSSTYRQVIPLIQGSNIFSAVTINDKNVESDAQFVEIFSEDGLIKGKCYILSVGINQYKNQKLNLNYARPDAESFTSALVDNSKLLFEKIEYINLFDGEATRRKILEQLDRLSSIVKPEDVFILYYAGHGSMVENKFYFIPTESARLYDGSALQKEAIEAGTLQEHLKSIKALKQLIIMDACQSGGSVELLAARGASEEKAIAQLSRSAGIHVMASAGSEQFAAEFSELGHGLFTYVLIKALEGEADGAPKDGKVTIYELKSYLDDQVPEMTRKLKGRPQYPYTFSRGQDFPVVIRE